MVLSSLSPLYAQKEEIAAEETAPPVFSKAQIGELKDRFIFWMGKHYRCLFTGPCTKAEKEQVTLEWKQWGKCLGFLTIISLLAYFGYTKGMPIAREKARAAREEIMIFGEELARRSTVAAINAAQESVNQLLDQQRTKIFQEGGDLNKFKVFVAQIVVTSLQQAQQTAQALIQEGKIAAEEMVPAVTKAATDVALQQIRRLEPTWSLTGGRAQFGVKPEAKKSGEGKLEVEGFTELTPEERERRQKEEFEELPSVLQQSLGMPLD